MKRQNDQPLGEVIQQWLNDSRMREKLNEKKLIAGKEEIFGKAISKYIERLFVKQKKLYLKLSSAQLRQELLFRKIQLIERINEKIERGFIEDVVLT